MKYNLRIAKLSRFILVFVSFAVLHTNIAIAQNKVTTNIDKKNILIGDQITLTLKTPKNTNIIWNNTNDSVGKFEIISKSKIDTTQNEYIQRITLTTWDSGNFTIKPLPFYIRNNQSLDSFFSDSVLINVKTVAVDTSKPFKDIKPNVKVGYTTKEIIQIIFQILFILLALIAVIYLIYIQLKQKKKSIKIDEDALLLPHEKALKYLKKLEEKEFLLSAKYKEHYTELSDIIRHYLDAQFQMQTLESTTDEILREAKKNKLSNDVRKEMKNLFETADLVKFAKILPSPFDNEQTLKNAYQIIEKTKPIIQEQSSSKNTTK